MILELVCLFEKGIYVIVYDYRELGEKWIFGIIVVIIGLFLYELEIVFGIIWRRYID